MLKSQIKDEPLVTVITVTYNSAFFVRQAIESILVSSYSNFELIIGDDSSTDNTWQIVNEFSDPRIVKYRNERNLGEYPNRNKAIQLAKGEYLIFIDGDDMIYPHGLEFMVKMLHASPDCGMALMYPFLNWVFLPIKISPHEFYISNFFSKGFNDLAFANTLFVTSKLKQGSKLPTNYRAGDTYIRLELAAKFPTLIIQDQLTWWRETPGQASKAIFNTSSAIIENYLLHKEIIEAAQNPLTEIEKAQAIGNELFKIKTTLFSYAIRMKWGKALNLLHLVLSEGILIEMFISKKIYVNPFRTFSPAHPKSFKLSAVGAK